MSHKPDTIENCRLRDEADWISIDDVRAANPDKIYYGATTCWWTHRAEDLGQHPNGLPCDARGAVLMETDDVEGFLKAAEENASHYGKHTLRAFEAAHHGNVVLMQGPIGYPWCFWKWDTYNDLLDARVVTA